MVSLGIRSTRSSAVPCVGTLALTLPPVASGKSCRAHRSRTSAPAIADAFQPRSAKLTLTTTLNKHGANLELRSDEHFTALHVGCVLGHAGCVRLLVAAAADVHARATLGATPLILAAR